jgi:hypothetical protein
MYRDCLPQNGVAASRQSSCGPFWVEPHPHDARGDDVVAARAAAELIRHQLETTVLPVSVANRFPDLRRITLHPPLLWTLSIASATTEYTSRSVNAFIDTLIRHVDH